MSTKIPKQYCIEDYKKVNISDLSIGTYKNYTELCKVLHEPVKGGCSKKSQLENWARYFNFTKEEGSQTYVVTDIYTLPSGIKLQEKSYANQIYEIILLLLYQQILKEKKVNEKEYSTISATKYNIIRQLGMVGSSFHRLAIDAQNLDLFTLSEYKGDVYSFLSTTILRALGILKRNKNILFDISMIVIDKDAPLEQDHRVATFNEQKRISEIEGKILRKMGCKSEFDAFLLGKFEAYYNLSSTQIEEELGIIGHYDTFNIHIINSLVAMDSVQLLNGRSLQSVLNEKKKALNERIVTTILSNNKHQAQNYLNDKKSQYAKEKIHEEFSEELYGFNFMERVANAYQTKRDGYTDNYVKKESSMTEKK